MKQMAVFLSGVAATVTGAFLRSCNSGMEMDLASAWCGKAPPTSSLLTAHAHCAGCVLAFAGLLVVGLATTNFFIQRSLKRATVRVGQ